LYLYWLKYFPLIVGDGVYKAYVYLRATDYFRSVIISLFHVIIYNAMNEYNGVYIIVIYCKYTAVYSQRQISMDENKFARNTTIHHRPSLLAIPASEQRWFFFQFHQPFLTFFYLSSSSFWFFIYIFFIGMKILWLPTTNRWRRRSHKVVCSDGASYTQIYLLSIDTRKDDGGRGHKYYYNTNRNNNDNNCKAYSYTEQHTHTQARAYYLLYYTLMLRHSLFMLISKYEYLQQ